MTDADFAALNAELRRHGRLLEPPTDAEFEELNAELRCLLENGTLPITKDGEALSVPRRRPRKARGA